MNKILLLACVGVCVVSFAAGSSEENSKVSDDAAVSLQRVVRAADVKKKSDVKQPASKQKSDGKGRAGRKLKRKNKSKKKKSRKAVKPKKQGKPKKGKEGLKEAGKGRKERKRIKGKKGRSKKSDGNNKGKSNKRNNKKKSGRKNNKKKSGKRNNKKKSGKRNKKSGKRNNRNKSGKRNNKKKSGQRNNKNKSGKKTSKKNKQSRQSGCRADSDCLANVVKYMKQLKEKVANFESQEKRITKFISLSSNKGGKKSLFKPVINRLVSVGGGNSSNLNCLGATNSSGAQNMSTLVANLKKCESGIEKACMTEKPAYNQSDIDACKTKMTTFSTEVKACIDETDATKKCACWKADTLKNASDALSSCDISKLSTKVAAFKKSCTTAFSECRKAEDSVSEVIFACGPSKSPAKQIEKLKTATGNKDALQKLNETIAKITGSARRFRRQAFSCSEFTNKVSALGEVLKSDVLASNIQATAEELTSKAPTSCSAEEKKALKEKSENIGKAIVNLEEKISTIQKELEESTGTTASSSEISATTAAPSSTNPSTAVPSARFLW